MKKNNMSLFAVSFKQGFTSPNVPIATFHQGDKELVFLLDTGSDNNVIDKEALQQFKHTMHDSNKEEITHLSGVGGVQEVQTCTLSFSCEDENYTTDFLITDLRAAGFDAIRRAHCIIIHGILGSTFLKENHVVLDYKDFVAYSKQ